MNDFSKRLQAAMEAKKINISELAEKAGLNKGTISHYISGNYKPKRDSIAKIAQALNVQPAWLMGFDVPFNLNENKELVEKINKLDPIDKGKVAGYIDSLLESEKYKKKETASAV